MASSIGTSHLSSGAPCQDSHCHHFVSGRDGSDVLILVAADGAGTAARSNVGSWLACKTFAGLVDMFVTDGGNVADLNRTQVESWITTIRHELAERAAADEGQLRDYACTLLAVITAEDVTAFLQIGDGAIVVSNGEEDGWSYVFWPQHGEFANTTNFIISPNATSVLEFELAVRPILEVAIFTDGIENLVLHNANRAVHEPFFRAMFPAVRRSPVHGVDADLSKGLDTYLSTPSITDRTDDDKTLILATRMAPSPTKEMK